MAGRAACLWRAPPFPRPELALRPPSASPPPAPLPALCPHPARPLPAPCPPPAGPASACAHCLAPCAWPRAPGPASGGGAAGQRAQCWARLGSATRSPRSPLHTRPKEMHTGRQRDLPSTSQNTCRASSGLGHRCCSMRVGFCPSAAHHTHTRRQTGQPKESRSPQASLLGSASPWHPCRAPAAPQPRHTAPAPSPTSITARVILPVQSRGSAALQQSPPPPPQQAACSTWAPQQRTLPSAASHTATAMTHKPSLPAPRLQPASPVAPAARPTQCAPVIQ